MSIDDRTKPGRDKAIGPRRFRGKPVIRYHAMVKPIGPTCNLDKLAAALEKSSGGK